MDSQPKLKDFEKSVPTLTRRGSLCALAVVTLGLIPKPAVAASGVKVLKNGRVVLSLVFNQARKVLWGNRARFGAVQEMEQLLILRVRQKLAQRILA